LADNLKKKKKADGNGKEVGTLENGAGGQPDHALSRKNLWIPPHLVSAYISGALGAALQNPR